MGQKIHPIGLRIGIHRKWNQTWFAPQKEAKTLFFQQKNIENFFKAFFQKFAYTKLSMTKKLLVVDLKFFKYYTNSLYLFVFFYKLRTKRRKNNIAFSSNFKNKKITKIFTRNTWQNYG
jgi:hypothetical protein